MGHHFIAIVPESLDDNLELKQLLGKVKRTFREKDYEARWVSPDLWHVTVQFLGALTPKEIEKLPSVLEQWKPDTSELLLRLQGLGAFPAADHARVLWLGVQQNQQLLDLQAELAIQLRAHDYSLESKEYQPHLTLAKLRNPHSLIDILGLGGRKHFGDYKVRELIVFESMLEGNMMRYLPRYKKSI